MATILSILVYLGVLFLNVWYPQAYVDQKIQQYQHEIRAVQEDEAQMQQVKRYNIKHDPSGNIVIFDADEID